MLYINKNIFKENIFYTIVPLISFINSLVLLFNIWIKYNIDACTSCNQSLPIPISSVTIALIGFVTALILTLITILSNKHKLFQIMSILLAGICSFFASYLELIQIKWLKICYPCTISAILFYMAFGILLYQAYISLLCRGKH